MICTNPHVRIYWEGYECKPQMILLTVKKPKLYENRAKFNATPKSQYPPRVFSSHAPANHYHVKLLCQ